MNLSDARHAFVTGGASGIGLGIAHALADRGVCVTLADVDRDALAAAVAERPDLFRAQPLDTRDRAGWAVAKAEAEAAFGPVDVLVNNAGIAPDGKELADMDPESFDRVISINLVGVFNGVSAFAADFRARKRGHIVNTASMSGMVPDNAGLGSYGPSKAGVIALTESLRQEMAPHGVGVSAFCPGTTATKLMENTRKRGGEILRPDASLRDMPVKPAEVAAIVLRGIEADRAWIFTHPERRSAVERRHDAIMTGFDAV